MTTLSANQVAAAAYAGGFRGNQIAEAVAVAYAESSWNTTSSNSCCHGLWQINTSAHPNMKPNVYDPVQNAKYAHQIYSSEGGWCRRNNPPNCNPFQGYGNSNYKKALPQGKAAQTYLEQQLVTARASAGGEAGIGEVLKKILGGGISPITAVAPGLPNPLSAMKAAMEAVNRIGRWVTNPDNLIRVMKVIAGVVTIIVASATLLDKQIMNMSPVGKIAKMVKT